MSAVLHLVEFQTTFLLFIALAGYLIASRINQSAVIGMEFRLEDIAKPRYLLIGASGVVVPLGLGYGTAVLFGFPFAGAIFIATALTATSIAITANVLKEMGKLKSAPARAIIGAAVIDDVLGLLILAVGNGVVSGSLSLPAIAIVLGKAVFFLAAGGLLGHFLLRRLIVAIDATAFTKKYPEVTFLFAAMIAFFYGMAAEMLGLSAIVGAFIAGASLGGVTLRHGKDLHQGFEFLQVIFASIFFVSLGSLRTFAPSTCGVEGRPCSRAAA